jgi:hypothetical protein
MTLEQRLAAAEEEIRGLREQLAALQRRMPATPQVHWGHEVRDPSKVYRGDPFTGFVVCEP